jgi:hypothetical protein
MLSKTTTWRPGLRVWKASARARVIGRLLPEPARWTTSGGRTVERRCSGESIGTSAAVKGSWALPTRLTSSTPAIVRAASSTRATPIHSAAREAGERASSASMSGAADRGRSSEQK